MYVLLYGFTMNANRTSRAMTSSVKGHDRGIVGVWREPRRVVVDTDQCILCQNRKPSMPDERLLVISMSLDPTDDSSSSLVGHRLALAFLVCVLFFLLFHDIVTQFHSFPEGLEFSFVLVRSRPFWSSRLSWYAPARLFLVAGVTVVTTVACLDGPIGFPFVQNDRHSTMICHDPCHHPCHDHYHHYHPDEHCFSWPSFLSFPSVFHFQVFLHSFGPFDWLDDTRTPTRTPLLFTTPIHFFRNFDFHNTNKQLER